MAASTKRVRELVIGDEFFPPYHPVSGRPVRLVGSTVKTGAWYELSVHWVGETDVWVINPKPMGTERVRLNLPGVLAVVSS